MGHQQDFFGNDTIGQDTRQLAVTASPGRVLTKAQKAFNRLVARVEALRAEIKTTTSRLERALREHERDVRPRLDQLAALRKDLARTLATFLTDPRLKRAADRDLLGSVIADLIDDTAAYDGGIVDEDLRILFETLTKDDSGSNAEEEMAVFEAMRSHVERAFGESGVDIDLSDIRPDSTEEEIRACIAKARHAARERGTTEDSGAERPRRMTKKQLEREARVRQAEEARHRTIGTIYKQLAKALHPDLERDPERRREKLALMQELTAAHRANDLHTLLRLELAWLHREEGDIERLTDEKLAVYNTVLREQVAKLEHERDTLAYHPRFQALAVEDPLFALRLELNSADRAADLDISIQSMRGDLARLRSPDGMNEVRDLLKLVRAQQRHASRRYL